MCLCSSFRVSAQSPDALQQLYLLLMTPVPPVSDFSAWLSDRLATCAARCRIPGAAVAVVHRGQLHEAATGVLNVATQVAATPDSLFQVGSITKTFTATLVLQLVEQGRIALSDPVRKHLPWFAVASREGTERVTIEHLLTHSSGIDGDFFPDTGTDSDCVEKYVRLCATLGQVHPPGGGPSYTNAGFIILAAMLQEITGKSWDMLLFERILEPLQATHMTTDPFEFPRYRVAVGHLPDPNTRQQAVPRHLNLPRGTGPTGATLHASAADLARFGETIRKGGMTPSGACLLRADTIAVAHERRKSWPMAPWLGLGVGLGWMLYDWNGRHLFGHDGATVGQYAFLRVLPDAELTVALLTNGPPAKNLYYALFRDVFAHFAQVQLPQASEPIDAARFDVSRVVGKYRCKSGILEVLADHGELRMRTTPLELTHFVPPESWPLVPVAENACRIANPALDMPELMIFHDFDDGRARYASFNMRDLLREETA
jgi:CubicO group peptidase (beta-lactamase class C family)